jgi:hypothetical protein
MNVFKLIEENGLNLHGDIEHFAELIRQEEREKVAAWMIKKGYATGHGDSVEDLLQELDWQIREQEREACIDIVAMHGGSVEIEAAIRARGNT